MYRGRNTSPVPAIGFTGAQQSHHSGRASRALGGDIVRCQKPRPLRHCRRSCSCSQITNSTGPPAPQTVATVSPVTSPRPSGTTNTLRHARMTVTA
jgi:hypothetical protein